ncbi:MAG: SH3 domain-containing protein [Leptolyngbya sp. SIO1D8]|nr:SH3 domain-containing protein [Leptolyngbya sp. SIO1D8]
MKGFLVGLTKLILGVSLALVLLSLAGVATARYFMAKLSVLPPKPVFNNDAVSGQVVAETSATTETVTTSVEAATSPPPEVLPEAEKPPGSYDAVVVQPIGLVVRDGPGVQYEQLGGVDYNEQVLVLKTSEDGRWLNVRVESSGQEGWVKAGNTQNLSEPSQ